MFYRLFSGLLLLVCNIAAWGQTSKLDSLLNKLPTAKDDTAKVMLLRDIGNNYAHQDPLLAVAYWKQGVALGKRLEYIKGLARCYINIATGYSFAGMLDSSIIYSDTAIYYTRLTADPARLALVYLNRADNYVNLHNPRAALIYCDTALQYAEKAKDNDRLARIYHIIGDIYGGQKQYENTTLYFTKALELYLKDNNYMMAGQVYSDLGGMYMDQRKHDTALAYFKKALVLGDSTRDSKNLSAYNSDIGTLYLQQKQPRQARPYLDKALDWAKDQDNSRQYTVVYIRMADMYNQQKEFAAAAKAGEAAYQYALVENDFGYRRDAASVLSEAYAGLGDHKKAYANMRIALELNDSLYKQQYDAETATLEKNFEVGQKDKEIALLNKDKELQRQQLRSQQFYLIGSVVLVALAIAGIFLLVSRHRLRQRMKELELRNRIAADLHDEVGSSLSSIHMLSQVAAMQHGPGNGQTEILSKVSSNARETMDKMSDIVWMIKPGESEGLSLTQRMERFMYEMCAPQNITCTLDGTEALQKLKLSMQQRKNFYLVFKEALNNAVKYSGSHTIDITVDMHNRHLCLLVKDKGKGFNTELAGNGNGLDNMRNRAKELGGKLEILSAVGIGTEVQLLLPV
ncbi:MAG: tetratricopeptide repeat protein [Niastella sp.]|nr:tetratricopeptide repeat protein [Niastella sp.]